MPRDDGRDCWATKSARAERVEGIYPMQRQAEQRGREILGGRDGGDLIIYDRKGPIRSKDAIGRSDPFPPRDREH
jgi:hypothetical protein